MIALLYCNALLQVEYLLLTCVALLYLLVSIRFMTQYNLAYMSLITAVFVILTLVDIVIGNTSLADAAMSETIRNVLLGTFLCVQVCCCSIGLRISENPPSNRRDACFVVLSPDAGGVCQAMYILVAWFLRHVIPHLQMKGWFLIRPSLLDETKSVGAVFVVAKRICLSSPSQSY